MKNVKTISNPSWFLALASLLLLSLCFESYGQFGMPMGRGGMMGNPYGNPLRQMNQMPTRTEEQAPLTADDIVELSMNRIKETIELNAFEDAVIRSIMLEATKKRIELQILNLEPNEVKTVLEEIEKQEDFRLNKELPEVIYLQLQALKEEGRSSSPKKKKKKKSKNDS
jgi:hypothetical protein